MGLYRGSKGGVATVTPQCSPASDLVKPGTCLIMMRKKIYVTHIISPIYYQYR